MTYYAIGFGGTGAKCLESLIHLSAAGLMPSDQELYLLFVDQDRDNGSLRRAQELLESYKNCRIDSQSTKEFLRTKIVSPATSNWLPEPNASSTLGTFIHYGNASIEARSLFDVLFDSSEKATPMGQGFRGHPSIGATVFASTTDLNNEQPWNEIRSRLEREANSSLHSKVMVFGSVFGGTGAAGVPTISKLLRDWSASFTKNPFTLGGVLVLPYFSFSQFSGSDLHADSRDFLLNTQAALRFYHQQDYMEVFDSAYLIGCNDNCDLGEAAIGSLSQENPPHWIEFVAALAAVRYYNEKPGNEENARRYNLIARENDGTVSWSDLPFNTSLIRKKINNAIRFAFAFHSVYLPAIRRIALPKGSSPHWAPWYVEHFFRTRSDVLTALENDLALVDDYCKKFLEWVAGIEYSISNEGATAHLVDYTSFANLARNPKTQKVEVKLLENFVLRKFDGFRVSNDGTATNLKSLWSRMCESYSDATANEAVWKFVNELFRNCGR